MTAFPTPRVFALVNYVPGPLGCFLTRLRAELVSGCPMRSHLTLLPPRVLGSACEQLSAGLAEALAGLPWFEIELDAVRVFESTGVVYLEPGHGRSEAERLHLRLNDGLFAFPEAHTFHPHVTLAQDVPAEDLNRVLERAEKSWKRYSGPRSYRVDACSLVENISLGRWDPVSEHRLAPSRVGQPA